MADDGAVVVVGGTRAIGLELVKHFAQRGDQVVLTGQGPANVAAAVEAVRALGGGPVQGVTFDLARPESIAPALAGFLRRRDENLVMIILGDHQPPAGMAGEQPSWDVPVHVIASRPALLEPLLAAGFRPGLAPAPGSLGALHTLGPQLLDAFSGRRGIHAFETRIHVARSGIAGQIRE